jgi:hypothetical protein
MEVAKEEEPRKEAPQEESSIARVKLAIKNLQEEAFIFEGDYEAKLSYRTEIQGLISQIREIVGFIDESIIDQMQSESIRKSETLSFNFEWHPKSKTEWDKEKLINIVRDNNVKADMVVGLLNKGFALSATSLKGMGKTGAEILMAREVTTDCDVKQLVVRMKKEGV